MAEGRATATLSSLLASGRSATKTAVAPLTRRTTPCGTTRPRGTSSRPRSAPTRPVLGHRHLSTTTMSSSASASSMSETHKTSTHFCDACGSETSVLVPEGDNRPRRVCQNCGKVHYVNPKVVVGCLVEHTCEETGARQVLLCRRAIDPCRGLWTLPAGFQECGESTSEGAARETREEANAEVSIAAPYAHLDIPAISQTYVIFRGTFKHASASRSGSSLHSPGQETLETRLFDLEKLPHEEIAFSSVRVVLGKYAEDVRRGRYSFHHGVIEKEAGVAASSPRFKLAQYTGLPTEHKL
mmetsp:Transcript_4911/g.17221  ORF Transcript_4911/g.17221 Transcript_4911/m.17221 type:complete len:298 (+) Transcript_4911:60-953(+)